MTSDTSTTAELGLLLRQLYEENDEALRANFHRSLSFADGMFDRWERSQRLGFGEGSSIYNSSLVMGDVSIGKNTWVGPWVFLDGGYGPLSIGEYCSISAGVHIYTHDTVAWSLTGGKARARTGPVTVGDRCYIGSQSIVGAGVTIGSESVVATNSFVNRDVGPRTIVGGCPARVLGTIELDGDSAVLRFDSEKETS